MWKIDKITIETPEAKETYTYHVKVYDEGSQFGIDGGRISKLYIQDSEGRVVANYERGWDLEPQSMFEKFVLQVIKNLYS